MSTVGLVLSGGGARGAYQVGVISAIAEIAHQLNISNPIQILSGNSAGALNASFLAGGCGDFQKASKELTDIWSHLESDQVFLSDFSTLGKIGFKWIEELSFGAITGTTPGRALLDTHPLKKLIDAHLKPEKIAEQIQQGFLKALAITSLEYKTIKTVTFVQGANDLPQWKKARRHSELTTINAEHIMASSAIPILFPPVNVNQRFFGDGCVRNSFPISPAVRLGANKVIVIGVRKESVPVPLSRDSEVLPPSVAKILNVLLNAIMLDGIEQDVERLQRVNEFTSQVPENHRDQLIYKPIDLCFISPTVDIGEIAKNKSGKLPRMIRYLLKGLGSIEDASEIVSYLLFDPDFCTQLIEVGFEDGMKQKDEITQILST